MAPGFLALVGAPSRVRSRELKTPSAGPRTSPLDELTAPRVCRGAEPDPEG